MSVHLDIIVLKVRFQVGGGFVIRSYKVIADDELKATKENTDFHVKEDFSWMTRDELDELLDEYMAEARYLGHEVRLQIINEWMYNEATEYKAK